jgi:hypothetical protein
MCRPGELQNEEYLHWIRLFSLLRLGFVFFSLPGGHWWEYLHWIHLFSLRDFGARWLALLMVVSVFFPLLARGLRSLLLCFGFRFSAACFGFRFSQSTAMIVVSLGLLPWSPFLSTCYFGLRFASACSVEPRFPYLVTDCLDFVSGAMAST